MQVVVTKIDKCGRGALLTNIMNLQEVLKTQTTSCFPQPFLVRWEAHLLIQIISLKSTLTRHVLKLSSYFNSSFESKVYFKKSELLGWICHEFFRPPHTFSPKKLSNVQTPEEAPPPRSAALLSPSLRWTCLESSDSETWLTLCALTPFHQRGHRLPH